MVRFGSTNISAFFGSVEVLLSGNEKKHRYGGPFLLLSAYEMRAMMVLPVPWVSHGGAQSGKSETPVDLQFF
jgi:hypothetical protein